MGGGGGEDELPYESEGRAVSGAAKRLHCFPDSEALAEAYRGTLTWASPW
jgi:hypothetical protein